MCTARCWHRATARSASTRRGPAGSRPLSRARQPPHKNETTGGVTILRKFRAGLTVPAHIHPLANEYCYVLSGEWEESGAVYTTGAFFFAPKGVKHGPHHAKTEVISLTVFDGPLTVE